jgi:hypothetical protein
VANGLINRAYRINGGEAHWGAQRMETQHIKKRVHL